jgi:sulfotransferase family protein
MSFPPESYLIGAQKAGTTTLAYLLDQHPHISIGQTKEPHFFTDNWSKGLDWYRKQFPDSANTILLDASTSYSMAPLTEGWKHRNPRVYEDIPAKVHSVRPDAKFIYLLRDPVDRTYSGYWHDVRMGVKNEEFRTALQSNPFYLDVSDYYGQLLRWLDYFPLSSFHCVLFEEMKERPHQVVNECFAFLGLRRATNSIRLDSAKNQSHQVGWVGRRVNQIEVAYPRLRAVLKSSLPSRLKRFVHSAKAGSTPLPAMTEEERRFLVEYFRERNQNLQKLIGTSLDGWAPGEKGSALLGS